MRTSKFFLAVAIFFIAISSCTPNREKQTDEAIKAIIDEFQIVGLAATVVKDGEIIYNKSFGYKKVWLLGCRTYQTHARGEPCCLWAESVCYYR